LATESVGDSSQSHTYGAALGRRLSAEELVGVFVLSDGLNVDGSELVRGLLAELGAAVRVNDGRFIPIVHELLAQGGSVDTFEDITERNRAEAGLIAAHKQLLDISRQAGMAEVAHGSPSQRRQRAQQA
jgi:hypothetical protein